MYGIYESACEEKIGCKDINSLGFRFRLAVLRSKVCC